MAAAILSAAFGNLVVAVALAAVALAAGRRPKWHAVVGGAWLRVLAGGVAPLGWAVGRPTVYFPAGLLARLSAEQRLTLLAHELAHLRRRDHLVRWVESVALAVWWWCPLAWLARQERRRLEEEACDAAVTAAFPGSGHAYAAAILETIDFLAGAKAAPALASGLGDAASLRRRLVLVLEGRAPVRPSGFTRVLLALAGLTLLAVDPKPARLAAAPAAVRPRVPAAILPPAPQADGPALPDDEPADEPIQFLPTPTRLAVPTS